MLFNSINFLLFFPVIIILFFLIPGKWRPAYLLFASYVFYMSWSPAYVLFLIFSTITTWGCGRFVFSVRKSAKIQTKSGERCLLPVFAGTLLLNIGVLVFFKYADFGIEILNGIFSVLHLERRLSFFSLFPPVGISFYTLQVIGYLSDVYRGKLPAESNVIRYALFVSFFPQIISGPISRGSELLPQIAELGNSRSARRLYGKQSDGHSIRDGLTRMLWGFFLKLVIADRIVLLVDTVFDAYYRYRTCALLMAAIGFALQVYCDFAGYSAIATGAAKILGIHLPDNFDAPYLSGSIAAFWRRWHISLSTWLRDYIYIPLGGNRKGRARQYVNFLITFLVSGLWHGANWTFMIWGLLHGIYQIAAKAGRPLMDRIHAACGTRRESIGYRAGRVIWTFLLVDFAWIFFRADSVGSAFGFIVRLFTAWDPWFLFDGSVYRLGLDIQEMNILWIAVMVLFLADLVKKKKRMEVDAFLATQWFGFRWTALIFLLFFTLLFGCYGPGFDSAQFIYSQF